MTRLATTSLQTVGLEINNAQCVKAILSVCTRIFNFLARNDLQLNAFIYAADISPSAGDFGGWKMTLQSTTRRLSQYATYGGFRVEFLVRIS